MRNCNLTTIAIAVLSLSGLALIQTWTIWDYFGVRVDEKAMYMYAVGFLGGDLDPRWFGYGSLGMYLLAAVYLLLAIYPLAGGYFSSLEAYAMQAFYNGYFVLVARYVFALMGLGAVLLYARTAAGKQIPLWLIGLFGAVCVFSADNVYFANYLRCDYLVGFFVALAIFCAARSRQKAYLYLLAVAVAGAICSKISALPLVVFLLVQVGYRKFDCTLSWAHLAGILLTLIICLKLFQPFAPWTELIKGIIGLGVSGEPHRFNWGKEYLDALPERIGALFEIFRSSCTLPVLVALGLLVFTWRYRDLVASSLLMLALLVLPYLNSPEITAYWFAPAFNLVRFLALLGVAGTLSWLKDRLLSHPVLASHPACRRAVQVLLVLLVMISGGWGLVFSGYQNYVRQYDFRETNKEDARRWVEQHLLETAYIAIEPRYNHITPKLYDPGNLSESKRISRYFMYERHRNAFLNQLFETWLQRDYCAFAGVQEVKGVRRHRNLPPQWLAEGYYYITSPNIYNRYLNRDPARVPPHLQKEYQKQLQYHQALIAYPRIKEFRNGRGAAIEIYHIGGEKNGHEHPSYPGTE